MPDRDWHERWWAQRRSQIELINGLDRKRPPVLRHLVLIAGLSAAMAFTFLWWRGPDEDQCVRDNKLALDQLYDPLLVRAICDRERAHERH